MLTEAPLGTEWTSFISLLTELLSLWVEPCYIHLALLE